MVILQYFCLYWWFYKFHLLVIFQYFYLYLWFINSTSLQFFSISACISGFINSTSWGFCNISGYADGFINSNYWEFRNISGVMQQLMGWLKMKKIVSISPETRVSTFSGEITVYNAKNMLSPMLKPRQKLIWLENRWS